VDKFAHSHGRSSTVRFVRPVGLLVTSMAEVRSELGTVSSRYEVFMATTMTNAVFWDVEPR
jgi:hypothetical protein